MIAGQKDRFAKGAVQSLIENYIKDPAKYESEYIKFVKSEAVAQYKEYFQTDKDEYEDLVLEQNAVALSGIFENWQLGHKDTSSFQTFPLPKWDNELGFWANAVGVVQELSKIGDNLEQIENKSSLERLSQSSLVTDGKDQKKQW